MTDFNWKEKFANKITTAEKAVSMVKSGSYIFLSSACAEPRYLVKKLVEKASELYDITILQLLTVSDPPYTKENLSEKFHLNTFFIAKDIREIIYHGFGDYTPLYLSDIPRLFNEGLIPIDIAFISVSPPDPAGMCSLGVSVDISKSAVANAKFVIAQVNSFMPRTLGNSFIHIRDIDLLVPYDEPLVTIKIEEPDETLLAIAQNLAKIIDDGSTIECGIGCIPQALAKCLKGKKDLGIHTEMFSDWIIDLVENGIVTGARKNLNHGKIVASFCMGSERLYRYIDNNPLFEFHPTEYVNDPFIISQHDNMITINMAMEVDLTGQVCADSIGHKLYSGLGGHTDFTRGAARSRGGKPIVAMPSTAQNGNISRIVPHITPGGSVVNTRGDVHYVVTEYGIAYLHGKTIRERALALISIAHPKFRKELMEKAKQYGFLYTDEIEIPVDKTRYPVEFEANVTLKDGTQILIRPVKTSDEQELIDMLYSLSRESIVERFLTHTAKFSHKNIQRITSIDYKKDMVLVACVPSLGEEEIVGMAQYTMVDENEKVASIAFIVKEMWQQKGIGTLLMKHLSRIAIQNGINKFIAQVEPSNSAMLAVFDSSGYKTKIELVGNLYRIEIEL